jgi:hypothetical protein
MPLKRQAHQHFAALLRQTIGRYCAIASFPVTWLLQFALPRHKVFCFVGLEDFFATLDFSNLDVFVSMPTAVRYESYQSNLGSRGQPCLGTTSSLKSKSLDALRAGRGVGNLVRYPAENVK